MVFVIGGNGFVGSGYVKALQSLGRAVKSINRESYDQFLGARCDILINANGNSKKFLAKDDPKEEFQASVASVRNSLVDFEFKKYVFLSTSDIYPDCTKPELTCEDRVINVSEQSLYGFHKYLAELCVQHSAKDWLIIRQGGFVGEGMRKNPVFDVLHGDKLWVHPDSELQFINTEDSARLVMQLVEQDVSNQIFNLTAIETISVREIMKLAGRSVPVDAYAKPVRYEISTEKVRKLVSLPTTHETVLAFLSQCRPLKSHS